MASADIEYRCFVGGLAWAITDESLEQAFSEFGEVIESKIINDRDTGRSRGFGFVTFRDEESMRDAIEGMNGQDLHGRSITVNEAHSRGSGGGRYGGRRREGGGGGYGGHRREDGGGYGRRRRRRRGGGYGGGYCGGRERGYGGGGGLGERIYSRGGYYYVFDILILLLLCIKSVFTRFHE